jgi:hypothetical protein
MNTINQKKCFSTWSIDQRHHHDSDHINSRNLVLKKVQHGHCRGRVGVGVGVGGVICHNEDLFQLLNMGRGRGRGPAVGGLLLEACCWRPAAGGLLLVACCWRPAVGGLLLEGHEFDKKNHKYIEQTRITGREQHVLL